LSAQTSPDAQHVVPHADSPVLQQRDCAGAAQNSPGLQHPLPHGSVQFMQALSPALKSPQRAPAGQQHTVRGGELIPPNTPPGWVAQFGAGFSMPTVEQHFG
jgi:hypothetical protein